MKRIFLFFTVLMLSVTTLLAQRSYNQRKPKSPEQRAKMLTERMTKRLKLNGEQSSKILKINKETALEISALRKEMMQKKNENGTVDKESYKTQIRDLNKSRDAQTIALLDEQQKAEYAKMKEDAKMRVKKRMENKKGKKFRNQGNLGDSIDDEDLEMLVEEEVLEEK
ncbi:MAG: hypothetical protein SFU27_07470 [Thermonemataceae bacterium]|nr:hypothetical protein [Thermonemataceae bacterium]